MHWKHDNNKMYNKEKLYLIIIWFYIIFEKNEMLITMVYSIYEIKKQFHTWMTGCMVLGILILFSLINIYPDSWPVRLYPQSSHFHLLFLFCSDRHQRCYNSPARNMSSLKDQDTWLNRSHFQLIFIWLHCAG